MGKATPREKCLKKIKKRNPFNREKGQRGMGKVRGRKGGKKSNRKGLICGSEEGIIDPCIARKPSCQWEMRAVIQKRGAGCVREPTLARGGGSGIPSEESR